MLELHKFAFILGVLCSFALAAPFDTCHTRCATNFDFNSDEICFKGCDLFRQDENVNCQEKCNLIYPDKLNACLFGCNQNKSSEPKPEVPQTDISDEEDAISSSFPMIQMLMHNLVNRVGFGFIIRKEGENVYISRSNTPMTIEHMLIQHNEPDRRMILESQQHAWHRRLACFVRHMSYPIMLALGVLLFSCIVLFVVSIFYKLRTVRHRQIIRDASSLPRYEDIDKYKPNYNLSFEADPLPQKEPINA